MCVWRLQKRKRNRWPVLKETAVLYIYHILLPALRILAGSLTGTVA